MTIYFAGNEPDALNISGVVDSTGSYHDNNYNRVGAKCYTSQYATCVLPSEADTSTVAGVWLHGLFRYTTGAISQANINGLIINDALNQPVLRFNAPRPGGGAALDQVCNLVLYATDGTSGNSPTVAGMFTGNINAPIDFHIRKVGNDAKATMYLAGAEILTATLVNKTPRNVKSASFGALTLGPASVGWSEIIVADEDTRQLRYGTYYPTADGTHTDGAGTYADIDESGATDGGAIVLSNVADRQSWAVTKHGTHGGGAIAAVCVNGLVASDGTNDMQASIRIDSTDYDSADLGLGGTATNSCAVFNTKPSTSTGWGTANLTALEFGYEAVL